MKHEEIIGVGTMTFPKPDLEQRLSRHGKVFVFKAPARIIQHTENLARVEKNTIIRQIAQYDRPTVDTSIDWLKIFLVAALFIVGAIAAAT